MKTEMKNKKGFTLVELIVVIAIVAILSAVGFVSYTGYIRNSRNSVRQSNTSEIVNVITQFIAVNGRVPRCADSDGDPVTTAGGCYFVALDEGETADGSLKGVDATAGLTDGITDGTDGAGTGTDSGCTGEGCNDWLNLNVRKAPVDPSNKYYAYVNDGGDSFAVYATSEEADGYKAIVKGSENFDASVVAALQLTGLEADGSTTCNIEYDEDDDCFPYIP